MRKRIFISNIDSKLGFHLVEALRNDHEQLQNYTFIVGSSQRQKYPYNYHSSIHAIINYQDDANLLARAVLQSDIIILDVREIMEESEFIIKLLEQKAKSQYKNNGSRTYLVGIGSHMTWAHQKPNISKFQNGQKEQALAKFFYYQPQKEQKINQNDRDRRLPHHSWVSQRQIQRSLLNLNKFPNIRSCILTTGLIYGRDFPELSFNSLFNKCFSVQQQIFIYGEGDNVLPTVYIDDFCQNLLKVITILQNNEENKKREQYFISVDENLHTQLQLAQICLKNSGYVKEITKNQLTYITKQQSFYSQSIPLQKSKVFCDRQPASKSFSWYLGHKYEQILQYLELECSHYVIYGQQMDSQNLSQLVQHLSSVIQVFKQSQIRIQICSTKNIGKQQVDIHEISRKIQELYLKRHHKQNYVLVLTHILLDTSIVKKYNLTKFQLSLHDNKLLSHKYQQYRSSLSALLNNQCDPNDNQLMDNQKLDKLLSVNDEEPHERKQEDQFMIKLGKQYKKMDQYLLDNVIGYISQAFLQISQNPTLDSLIKALKSIYNRQSNIKVQ